MDELFIKVPCELEDDFKNKDLISILDLINKILDQQSDITHLEEEIDNLKSELQEMKDFYVNKSTWGE